MKKLEGQEAVDRDQRRNDSKVAATKKTRSKNSDIGPILAPTHPLVKKKCRGNLRKFLERYLPHRFPLKWSADHLALIASVQGIIIHGGLRALAMPRGSGKTTIIEGAAIWALLYGHRHFLQVVAATGKASRQILRNIQDELAFNDELAEDFDEVIRAVRALGGVSRRAEAQHSEGIPTLLIWTRDEVRLPAQAAGGGSVIAIAGITGAIRGAKASLADGSQVRPDLCLVDDFQTRDSAKSSVQVANRLAILQSDVLGLAGPGKKVACLCAATIIQRNDGAAQLLDRKRNPQWQGTTARLMNSMPSPKAQALWDQYAEIYREDLQRDELPQERKLDRATAFYKANRKGMDLGALAAWEERKSEGELSAIQHAMNLLLTRGEDAFFAEFQNDPRDLASSEQPQLDPQAIALRLNRIRPGVVPNGAIELVGFIDVGEHALWYGIGAFGDGFKGDLIAYGAFPDPGRRVFSKYEMVGAMARAFPTGSTQATWHAALSALCAQMLNADWPDEDGDPHRVSLCLIDAGFGESTDTVFEFCNRTEWKGRVIPSRGKGIGAKGKPMADWPKVKGEQIGTDWRVRRNKSRRQKEVLIGTNYWKSFAAGRLAAPMGGAGCFSLAGESALHHEMIGNHLTAEKRVRVSAAGRVVDEWVWKVGHDNDFFDVVVGLHVAASIKGITVETGQRRQEKPERMSFAEMQKLAREKRKL